MIIPIRCFSCGFPVAAFYEEFKTQKEKGANLKKVMDDLKVNRYCCRRMLLAQVDVIDEVAPYRK
ncbi:MAG: DNA-directed RNA polymerase subunit N [Candidatus Altiarchaeota archaeon]|nr:DNA-directed RNA polymerase subunit N [Candidatus Altiarchaeota archaeon]